MYTSTGVPFSSRATRISVGVLLITSESPMGPPYILWSRKKKGDAPSTRQKASNVLFPHLIMGEGQEGHRNQ